MTCKTCGNPVENEFHLCLPCLDQVYNAIRATPSILNMMVATIAKQARIGDGGRTGKNMHGPAPINVSAADWKYDLREAIMSAAHAVARITRQHPPLTAGFEHVCVWLAEKSDWLALNPTLAVHQTKIVKAYEGACRSVDRPADRVTVGRCGAKRIEGVCVRELVIGLRQSVVECPECGTVWDVHQRRADALSAAWVEPVRPSAIARALKSWGMQVSLKAVEHWIARDLLSPVLLEDDAGRVHKRYRLVEAYELAHRIDVRRKGSATAARQGAEP